MLFALTVFASIYGTDIPDSLRTNDLSKYTRCLRHEVNEANDPFPETALDAPTITQFSQLITYCAAERSLAISSLRSVIKQRHPDWLPEKLAKSAEFVLSGMELQMMAQRRVPIFSIHDGPPVEF
jgi:hypothetical protein